MGEVDKSRRRMAPIDSGIQLGPGEEVDIMDPVLVKNYTEQSRGLREIRGNAVAGGIVVELAIDRLLVNLFYPQGLEMSEKTKMTMDDLKWFFDYFMLKKWPLSFKHKIDILESLSKEHNSLSQLGIAPLLEKLRKVNDVRNLFAHNPVSFRVLGKKPTQRLQAILSCRDREITLDNNYFDGLNTLYREADEQLEDTIRYVLGEAKKDSTTT